MKLYMQPTDDLSITQILESDREVQPLTKVHLNISFDSLSLVPYSYQ